MKEVPIWQKSNLTLEEAAAYSGIGINKLRSMTDSDECKFVLWNGTKRLIKRRKLEVDDYVEGVLKCDRAILSRAITLVESNAAAHFETAQQVIQKLLPYTGKSTRGWDHRCAWCR